MANNTPHSTLALVKALAKPCFMLIAISIILFPSFRAGFAADPCPQLSGQIDKQKQEIDNLVKAYETLNEQFSRSVRDDYTAIAEGVLNELQRNEAIKIAFARKKVLKSLEQKRLEYAQRKEKFCSKCVANSASGKQQQICEKCPEEPHCQRRPASNRKKR